MMCDLIRGPSFSFLQFTELQDRGDEMLKIIKDLLDIIIKIILIKTLIKRRPRYRRGRHNKNQTKL